VLGHHADRPFGQEPVGQPLQLLGRDGGELAAEGDHDIVVGEGAGVGGESVRAGELVEHPPDCAAVQRRLSLVAAGDLADQPLQVDAQLPGFLLPALVQGLGGVVGLGRAGGVGHVLHQPPSALLAVLALQALQLGGDLLVPLGERPHEVLGHPLDGAVAPAVRLTPADAERA
jgi:hypothetical protein